MQLIDFALIGLAVAAPAYDVASSQQATTCPGLQGSQVVSTNNQAYKVDCAKWVDAKADAILRIVTTETGYKGCLTACDGTTDCGISQYTASDYAQTKGSCTLFKKGVAIKQASSNLWTLATKIGDGKKDDPYSGPKPKKEPKPKNGPKPLPRPGQKDKFGLVAMRSGSPFHNTGVTASKGSIAIGGKEDASCKSQSSFATFYLKDGEAWLYGNSAKPQKLWVDRSGMGQGLTGYTTGDQPLPPRAEWKGFAIDATGFLEFHGVSSYACPPREQDKDAGWSIWFTTSETPGFKQGCLPAPLKAVKMDKPVVCTYTPSS